MRLDMPLVRFGNILRWSDGHFGSGQLVVISGSSVGQLVVQEVEWSVGGSGGWVAS